MFSGSSVQLNRRQSRIHHHKKPGFSDEVSGFGTFKT